MAVEKMSLMRIVGSKDCMHDIFKQIVYLKKENFNLKIETSYDNYFAMHEFESNIFDFSNNTDEINVKISQSEINKCIDIVEKISGVLDLDIDINEEVMFKSDYNFEKIYDSLMGVESRAAEKVDLINHNKKEIDKLENFVKVIDNISDKSLNTEVLCDLNFFEFEIGVISIENTWKLKKCYENFGAIFLKIGNIEDSVEDLYMVVYPKHLKKETDEILKSLKWNKLFIPDGIEGRPSHMISQANEKIKELKNNIKLLIHSIVDEKDSDKDMFYKIYNFLVLEGKVSEIIKKAKFLNDTFALDIWVTDKEKSKIEKSISKVSGNYNIRIKTAEEVNEDVHPSKKQKNSWIFRTFKSFARS